MEIGIPSCPATLLIEEPQGPILNDTMDYIQTQPSIGSPWQQVGFT